MSFISDLSRFDYYSFWDRVERSILTRLDACGLYSPKWYMRDVIAYTGLSAEETLVRAQAKAAHKQAWFSRPRNIEADYRAFYQEEDWYIFRQPWRYRLYSWHFISKMLPPHGRMVEYGCGAACLTEWMSRRYPHYQYTVADIPSTSLEFVRFRLRDRKNVTIKTIGMGKEGLPLTDQYHLIICVDVLEHTFNPEEICEHLCDHLLPGGLLYIDFLGSGWGGENLEEARQKRPTALEILCKRLRPLKAINEDDTVWGFYQAFGSDQLSGIEGAAGDS